MTWRGSVGQTTWPRVTHWVSLERSYSYLPFDTYSTLWFGYKQIAQEKSDPCDTPLNANFCPCKNEGVYDSTKFCIICGIHWKKQDTYTYSIQHLQVNIALIWCHSSKKCNNESLSFHDCTLIISMANFKCSFDSLLADFEMKHKR